MRLKENITGFQRLINAHDRIFVIATGSSILEISDEIWNRLKDEFTIGIHLSYLTFMPSALIWADQIHTENFHNKFMGSVSEPILIMRNNAFTLKMFDDFGDWLTNIDYKFDESRYKGCLTSVWLLNILKNYIGTIYLLGFDFYEGHSYTINDFGMAPKSNDLSKSYIFTNNEDAIKQHEGFNMEIVNLNPKSKLKAYPFDKIEDVL